MRPAKIIVVDQVTLGHRVWRDRYGADPDVVRRVVRVDGEPVTAIGVMPDGVLFPFRRELWQAPQTLRRSLAAMPACS